MFRFAFGSMVAGERVATVSKCTRLGAFFWYKSDQDLSLLSRNFIGIRVGVVVKDGGKLMEKLCFVTSMCKVVTAVTVNKVFNRNDTHSRHTTLYLAMSADDNPCIILHVFPKNKMARDYVVRYDNATKTFNIPDGLRKQSIRPASADVFGDGAVQPIHAQLDEKSEIGAQSLQLVEYNADMRDRLAKIETKNQSDKTDTSQQEELERCFECHVETRNSNDHAEMCPVKHWFVSKTMEKYVKIPSVRWAVSFQSPINILLNGNVQAAQSGMKLFSGMSDSYFHFESNKKLVLMSTEYTRIRVPIVIEDEPGKPTEKLVLFTSSDRALICAKGSRRIFENNALGDHEHNTPLVLYILESPFSLAIKVHSAGGCENTFQIEYQQDEKKFEIPAELDIKSKQSPSMTFDAALPSKIKRK